MAVMPDPTSSTGIRPNGRLASHWWWQWGNGCLPVGSPRANGSEVTHAAVVIGCCSFAEVGLGMSAPFATLKLDDVWQLLYQLIIALLI